MKKIISILFVISLLGCLLAGNLVFAESDSTNVATNSYYSQQLLTRFSEGERASLTISVDQLGTAWYTSGLTIVVNTHLQNLLPTEVWQTTGANGIFTYSFQANTSNEMVGAIYRCGVGTGSTAAADWAVASLQSDITIEVKQNSSGVTALYLNGNEWVPHSSSGLSIPDGYLAIATSPGSAVTVKASQAAVEVNPKILDHIEIEENPLKSTYLKGEVLDFTGLKVNAVYTDNTQREITDYTASPANGTVLNEVGQQTITLSHTKGEITETTSFNVSVEEQLSGTSGYFSQQTLTSFSEGQGASFTISIDQLGTDWYTGGLTIVVNSTLQNTLPAEVWQSVGADGVFTYSFRANDSNQMVGTIYRCGAGTGSTAAADWAVASLQGDITIEVKQNSSGVTALYLNGNEWVPHSSSGLSIPDGYLAITTSPGSAVTIKASQASVDIIPKILDHIEIIENPIKTSYLKGEALDLTGLKVNAVYTDDTQREIADYTISPANGTVLNEAGQQTVTLRYTKDGITKIISFNVTIEDQLSGSFDYYSQQTSTMFSEGHIASLTVSVDQMGTDWYTSGLTIVVNSVLQNSLPAEVWQTTGADGVFTYSFQANANNQMVGAVYRCGAGSGSTAAADWAVASLQSDITIEVKQNASGITALYLNGTEWVPHSSSGLSIPDGYLAIATTPGSAVTVKASQVINPNPDQNWVELFEDGTFEKGLNVVSVNNTSNQKVLDFGDSVRQGSASWTLTQHFSKYDLITAEPVINADGSVSYSNPGKRITMSQENGENVLQMEMLASQEYDEPRQSGESWPHLLIEQNLGSDTLDSYDQLIFTMSVRKDYIHNLMGEDYDSALHCYQTGMVFIVQNMNTESVGYGEEFFWFTIPCFDSRMEYKSAYCNVDNGKADASGQLIYQLGGKAFFDTYYTDNPMTNEGEWCTVSIDILLELENAFNTAQRLGYMSNSNFEDLRLQGVNFGCECTGTFDASISIKNVSLLAHTIE